jgi:hypothetical protein
MIDIKSIPGYSLFKTDVERKRAETLLQFVEPILAQERIRWLIPNMAKDTTGKIINIGFFVFFRTVVIEFRNFLSSMDFDLARYDFIHNVRFAFTNLDEKNVPTEASMGMLKIFHTMEIHFGTTITVFGKEACEFLYTNAKGLSEFLK